MTRELTSHKVNGLNEVLKIDVLDEPGQGNACHRYQIAWSEGDDTSSPPRCVIEFQNGPIKEFGINGISNEALLAIVEDRLAGFQSGPFACDANQVALEHVRDAMETLHDRTIERVARGVEGTHAK
jgi:hypothetical protein